MAKRMSKGVEFGRCIWENYPIKIRFNYFISSPRLHSAEEVNEEYTCPHVREDGILRAVVIGTNEGGHNTTGICLECILDYIKEHLLTLPQEE